MTTSFVKDKGNYGGNWAARISGTYANNSNQNSQKSQSTSLFFYFHNDLHLALQRTARVAV